MKVKNLIIASLAALSASHAGAQVSLGIMAGTNISFGYIDMQNYILATDHIGAKTGVSADVMFSDSWSAQLGALYSSYGFTYSIVRLRTDAVEIPITVAYKTGKPGDNRFTFAAGTFVGVQANTVVKPVSGVPSSLYATDKVNYTSHMEGIYFGAIAIVGYELSNGLFARLSFQPGLKQLVVPYEEFNAWYNAQTSFCIGYQFHFGNSAPADKPGK